MSVAYIIEALYEETLRLLDREAEMELGQIGRQFLRWLDNHLPRMPYDGWRDDFDDFIAMLAREHAIVAEESYHAWIQWLQEANDAAQLDGREPGTPLPFRFYTYDNKYAPPKVTLNKPAPFDPDYPQLRGTGNAIMEHNPLERWGDLAKLCIQNYRVPQEIKDAFVGWLEDERRKALGFGLPPRAATATRPADDANYGAGNASAFDRAFPEPPFAQALGLPKINNPPLGDTARRLNLTFPPGGVPRLVSSKELWLAAADYARSRGLPSALLEWNARHGTEILAAVPGEEASASRVFSRIYLPKYAMEALTQYADNPSKPAPHMALTLQALTNEGFHRYVRSSDFASSWAGDALDSSGPYSAIQVKNGKIITGAHMAEEAMSEMVALFSGRPKPKPYAVVNKSLLVPGHDGPGEKFEGVSGARTPLNEEMYEAAMWILYYAHIDPAELRTTPKKWLEEP